MTPPREDLAQRLRKMLNWTVMQQAHQSWRDVLRDAADLLSTGSAQAAPQALNIEAMRANLHATYNGGWSDDECRAFHHGMDTVCNLLSEYQKNPTSHQVRAIVVTSRETGAEG